MSSYSRTVCLAVLHERRGHGGYEVHPYLTCGPIRSGITSSSSSWTDLRARQAWCMIVSRTIARATRRLYEPISNHGSHASRMVYVTTLVYRDHTQTGEGPPSWRVRSCTIEFGPEHTPLAFSSDWVYASPEAARDDMRTQALEKIRLSGYTGPEEDIVWRLHMIG